MAPVHELSEMLSGMSPQLVPGAWVFCTTEDPVRVAEGAPHARATFREDEGASLILPVEDARRLGFDTRLPMRCITLEVHSALDGVGLTAAVAGVLAEAGIACNMVAAYHHDHVFVPAARAEVAVALLEAISRRAAEAADG